MKKSTKSAKSPAPATKSTAAKSAQPRKSPAAKRAPVAKPAAKPARKSAAPKAKAAPVAVPVPTSTPAVVTTVTAVIDIGFGNILHIRGDGPGLSWDRGLPMECVNDNQWRITLSESGRPFAFKFLVNDLSWSVGADYVVEAGSSVTFEPAF